MPDRIAARAVLLIALACSAACCSEVPATPAVVGPDPAFAACSESCGLAEFRVTPESRRVTHEGRSYYVCCDACADRFAEEPARFAVR